MRVRLRMDICFILDGILILYGIILTVLYCRLRVRQTGTHTHRHDEHTDTYETIKMDKKAIV
uniref:Fc receptor, IgE, high affinity I, gamma polypeptide like n=1 Tax=Amphilophus citrinellus TaxID=61819 RepID=A0A3Q0RWF3_AMPCI